MTNPTAAMIVIGDEILSGRTRDSNLHHLANALTDKGISLREARVIADDRTTIIATVRELAKRHDHVFTSGGIGPTHDDITAEAVAEAMQTAISVRDDARAILQRYYDTRGLDLTEARLRMARIPDGAALIDNPISGAPGFSLRNIHVMAGVPRIFEAMVAGLLPRLTGGQAIISATVQMMGGEGDLADPLARIAARYPDLAIGSYPFERNGKYATNIVIRGFDDAAIRAATADVEALK